MAGGKETPRQKMIGMMYLVLTALLAMNISKDILLAFVNINEGLEMTNQNFADKNAFSYNLFDKALMNDREKVKPFHDKATQVKKLSEDLNKHIDLLKKHLMQATDKLPDEVADTITIRDVEAKDNYDIPTTIMIGSEPQNPKPKTEEWSALELKEKVRNYQDQIKNLVGPAAAKNLKLSPDLDRTIMEDAKEVKWEVQNFYYVPLAAVIVALSKIQADVRNAEADVIKLLYSNISADDFKFDTLAPYVIPNSNYVLVGDTYRADIIVAAYSRTQNPVLEIGELDSLGQLIGEADTVGVSVEHGVASYHIAPKTEGPVEWGGIIKVKKPDGSYAPYPFKSEYMVAKPSVVVSPTKMNVFYRGLENPVDVSAAGFAAEDLSVSISSGSIFPKNKAEGHYVVKPGSGGKANITVTAKKGDSEQRFPAVEFRVKSVPDPVAKFAGVKGGPLQRTQVIASAGVQADMEAFDFDLRFTIISYTVSSTYKGQVVEASSNSAYLTSEQKTIIKNVNSGAKFYIENIKARGPDGTVRNLSSIAIKVI